MDKSASENAPVQVFLEIAELGGIAFRDKPEAFRLFQHIAVHVASRLPGAQIRYVWNPLEPSLVNLVVIEEYESRWEERPIIIIRRFSLETRRVSKLTLRLEIDDETDSLRCQHIAPSGTTWIAVKPETVVGLVAEAEIFWGYMTTDR